MVKKHRRAIAAFLAAAAVATLLAACGGGPPGKPPASDGTTVNKPVPPSIENVQFTTSTGARMSLSDLRGKVVVLTDFLTLCGEECPMTSANMNLMARTVAKDKLGTVVVFVEFTVDPGRDTQARLADYRNLYPTAGNWILVTTTPANLAKFSKYFGVYYAKTKEANPPDIDWLTGKPLTYDIAHQDAVIFLDQQGHERFLLLGNANTQGAAPPTTLNKFMDTEGQKNLKDPGPLSWNVPEGLQVVSWLAGKEVTS